MPGSGNAAVTASQAAWLAGSTSDGSGAGYRQVPGTTAAYGSAPGSADRRDGEQGGSTVRLLMTAAAAAPAPDTSARALPAPAAGPSCPFVRPLHRLCPDERSTALPGAHPHAL
ncbi:hypothetical protein Stsp02_52680 [Streptomyces sp. NBRC 14336]|nr:hypothetical protein Stsp02_52680 [Streptomyces sp. NBRC 14336]